MENETHVETQVAAEDFAITDIAAYARTVAGGRTVQVFDTTLRDGEQSPGATLHEREKLEIARQLARLGVDIMEAGFPIASDGDFRAVQKIAWTVGRQVRLDPQGQPMAPPIIAGLARALEKDIHRAAAAVEPAIRPRIHTFIATSDIHLEHKLLMSRNEVLESVGAMVELARSLCDDVEFSPEDAGRSDVEYLKQVLAVAIQAGATTLNIPDTVGYTMSSEYGALIERLVNEVPGGKEVIFSTHTHNDLGLATANSLAGVKAGARQVEVAINGIGERAGNASLEEFTMALHTRGSYFHLNTNVVTEEIHKTSEMVSRYTGMVIQPNKAVVGANAFQHEAGIHQDGVLKNRENYEIMRAVTVGRDLVDKGLPLGKHSGRHAVGDRLHEMGYDLDKGVLQEIYERFMQLADRKKEVSNVDLEAIAGDVMYQPEETWALEALQVNCGSTVIPTAVVILKNLKTGEEFTDAGFGTGPVDAVYKGINRIVQVENTLTEYLVQAVTQGMDSNGDVTIRIEMPTSADALETAQGRKRRRLFSGRGVDTDIVTASAKAYLQALNKQIANH